mmetsp:Transcript_19334/g.27986  ORF Transcript_19334/g.27986 Transcript_19334/m.27986 type:complete len:124 (+) Transcript_19334:168-539(+)
MGGHKAWKKRVKAGLLAKETGGGAICRHRPHMGRKGKDLIKNRKGHIGGGNPKKMKKKQNNQEVTMAENEPRGRIKSMEEDGELSMDDFSRRSFGSNYFIKLVLMLVAILILIPIIFVLRSKI